MIRQRRVPAQAWSGEPSRVGRLHTGPEREARFRHDRPGPITSHDVTEVDDITAPAADDERGVWPRVGIRRTGLDLGLLLVHGGNLATRAPSPVITGPDRRHASGRARHRTSPRSQPELLVAVLEAGPIG